MSIRNYYITLVSVALGGLVFSTLLYFEFQKRVHDRTFAHLETVLTCKIHSIEVLKDSMGLSKKEINQLFTDRHLWEKAGMGKTGESILVDSFYRLENDPRFPERASYLITSDAIERALSGKSGRGIMRDYGNVKVFAVYSSIEIHGETHAVVSKIDFWEIYISFLPTRSLFVLLCAMSLFGFGAFYKLIRQHQKTVRVKESVIHTDGESIVSLRRQDGPVVIKLSAPHHIGDRYIIGVVEDATEKINGAKS